jgi:hypothetical protein
MSMKDIVERLVELRLTRGLQVCELTLLVLSGYVFSKVFELALVLLALGIIMAIVVGECMKIETINEYEKGGKEKNVQTEKESS